MKIALNPVPVNSEPLPTRRDFCALACQAAAVMAAAGLAACGGDSPSSPSGSGGTKLTTVSGTTSGRVVSVTVDSASPLNNVGGLATVQVSLGTYLLARTGASSFSALTAICTHEQCTVSEFAGAQFHCPCHGSEYATTGAVTKGPATGALTSYPTQFQGTVLSFTV